MRQQKKKKTVHSWHVGRFWKQFRPSMFRKLRSQTKWWGQRMTGPVFPAIFSDPLPFCSGLLSSSLFSGRTLSSRSCRVCLQCLHLCALPVPFPLSSFRAQLRKSHSSWGLPCNILSHLMSPLPWPPKHMAWAPRFWHLDYFSALVLSSPMSSTLCSAHCPHKHHVSSIINFMRVGVCLIHFYIIGSTWQRPRPLRALKLNGILAVYCNHRPDFC